MERLSPRLGERYGEEGADPGWVDLAVVVVVVLVMVDGGEVCVSEV